MGEGAAQFFASGHAADLILGVLLIEAAWLRLRRGWSWGELAGLLGPAALIVLGLIGSRVGSKDESGPSSTTRSARLGTSRVPH